VKFDFKKSPFNLDILVLSKEQIRSMTPVTKLNIFEPSSDNFDPAGLFSTEIFGMVGSKERNELFSYINLRIGVLHPLIYKHVITARLFYKEVLAGTKYAIYDNTLKDLVLSTEEDGRTGYSFFMEVLEKIKLDDNDSDLRRFKVKMIETYGNTKYLLKHFLVLPAGVRDYRVNPSGLPEEDEVNDKYRKLLTLSNALSNIAITTDTIATVDSIRYRIQESVLELYEHITGLLDGKRKFIQGKWGTRGLLYGTRNVITPSLANISNLDDDTNLGIEHTTVGLYQYARAITPITMNKIHTTFISKIFSPDSSSAYLVNPKSMATELVSVTVKSRDTWLTLDGLDDMLGTLEQEDLRSGPIMIDGNYLMLLHDDGKVITPIFNTETMREDFSLENLRPITYYELLFIALTPTFDKYRALVTRYPVINLGGVYPSKIYVKSTNNPRKVTLQIGLTQCETNEYPNYKEAYFNSLSPHYAFLEGLGADFDGKRCLA